MVLHAHAYDVVGFTHAHWKDTSSQADWRSEQRRRPTGKYTHSACSLRKSIVLAISVSYCRLI